MVLVLPVTLQDIKEHHDYYSITDICTTHTTDYRQLLKDGAFLWIVHHNFVRSTFSEEILATNYEQLDALIEHLQEYRERISKPPEWMSEKNACEGRMMIPPFII